MALIALWALHCHHPSFAIDTQGHIPYTRAPQKGLLSTLVNDN